MNLECVAFVSFNRKILYILSHLSLKAKIIQAYLKGDKSFKMLGNQYSIHPGVISRWVRVAKQGHPVKDKRAKITKI